MKLKPDAPRRKKTQCKEDVVAKQAFVTVCLSARRDQWNTEQTNKEWCIRSRWNKWALMEEEEKPPVRYREAPLSVLHLPIALLLVQVYSKNCASIIVNDSHRALSTTGTSDLANPCLDRTISDCRWGLTWWNTSQYNKDISCTQKATCQPRSLLCSPISYKEGNLFHICFHHTRPHLKSQSAPARHEFAISAAVLQELGLHCYGAEGKHIWHYKR